MSDPITLRPYRAGDEVGILACYNKIFPTADKRIGPRTLEQLTGALRALKIKFTKAEMKKLDEIWPGPGGEAPEAYAW